MASSSTLSTSTGATHGLAAHKWLDHPLVRSTLVTSDAERQQLLALEAAGVQQIRPVALPEGPHLVEGNQHLGWPVGIKIGGTLLCAYHRNLRHHGSPSQNAASSHAVVTRSTDGGRTWSDPVDLRALGVNRESMVLHFGLCFGALGKDVFLATTYGLYRSGDEGRTWTLIPDALTQKQTRCQEGDSFGPRMIVHPEKGLVIPVGVQTKPYMNVYNSTDRGLTWKREAVPLSDAFHPLEPTGLYHDGLLLFVSRNHQLPFRFHTKLNEPQRPVVLLSTRGWFPFTQRGLSNISSYSWPDTTDVDFNPVTRRYEAVVNNRFGGVGEREGQRAEGNTVSLWSIAREDLLAGRSEAWRFEATLLQLQGGNDAKDWQIDAAHPGGGAIDAAAGVQHIFIYAGTFSPPIAGVYRITRTLDTDKLRAAAQTNATDDRQQRTTR